MAKTPKLTAKELAALDAEMEQEWREEALILLHNLEAQMYLENDKRADVILQALELLEIGGVGSCQFKPAKLTLE